MRLVEQALTRPSRCAVIPWKSTDPEGFIDTGEDLPGFDNHVYVSVTAIKEMARIIGLPTREVYEEAHDIMGKQDEELDQLRARVQELEAELEAVETLRKKGWQGNANRSQAGSKAGAKAGV